MQLYYALTDNDLVDLGMHNSPESADYMAVDSFNMHCAPNGYVVVNHRQLEAIKNILDRRGVGVY
jgi:hypothetical protein